MSKDRLWSGKMGKASKPTVPLEIKFGKIKRCLRMSQGCFRIDEGRHFSDHKDDRRLRAVITVEKGSDNSLNYPELQKQSRDP